MHLVGYGVCSPVESSCLINKQHPLVAPIEADCEAREGVVQFGNIGIFWQFSRWDDLGQKDYHAGVRSPEVRNKVLGGSNDTGHRMFLLAMVVTAVKKHDVGRVGAKVIRYSFCEEFGVLPAVSLVGERPDAAFAVLGAREFKIVTCGEKFLPQGVAII